MKDIIIPVLWFMVFGLVFGVLLAVASKIFAVRRDERAEKMTALLPGANCGGCGYAGCSAYAEAVARGEAEIGKCNSGGSAVARAMGEIMGVSAGEVVRMRAQVMCSGGDNAVKKYVYNGAMDCISASRLGGGDKLCRYACLGLGTCATVCKSDAIRISGGVATVIPEKCIGCGACVGICPKNVMELIPYSAGIFVGCKSGDNGKETRNNCAVGCIGCRICEKQCDSGAVRVTGNHAVIDYSLCVGCGKCAEKCPRKIIHISSHGAKHNVEIRETVNV